jgi:predicted RNA-binding Zn ribbon-like protein
MRRAAAEPIPAPPDDLCLGYANTRFWRGTAAPTEMLSGFTALLAWLKTATGRRTPKSRRRHQDRLFAEAIGLRETIYRIFTAVALGRPVADADLAALNRALARVPARRRLVRRNGYAWAAAAPDSVPSLLAPVLWSAADLLARAAPVRACANDACRWLFVDRSKAGRRRWCMMSACGNRHKARRHYLKSKRSKT